MGVAVIGKRKKNNLVYLHGNFSFERNIQLSE